MIDAVGIENEAAWVRSAGRTDPAAVVLEAARRLVVDGAKTG